MSFLSKFRLRKRPELIHPVFGRITYEYENTWECGHVLFGPINKEVEVLIIAGPEGPDERHNQYLSELSSRWPELKASWEPLLRSALQDWIEKSAEGDIWGRVDVECIDIFPGGPPVEWDFGFYCKEASHWPTIMMEGWIAKDCYIDG